MPDHTLTATAIQKQVNRIMAFLEILDKKNAKKGDFIETYDILLTALGGNLSSPECDGTLIIPSSPHIKYIGRVLN